MKFRGIFMLFAVLLIPGCAVIQRQVLFYPTHEAKTNGLTEWRHEGPLIGYSRQVTDPENVWLMLHGNGGQAADRVYALSVFPERDSVYILEYPGYGLRPGQPSKAAFDAAAIEAYRLLRRSFPNKPVCVVGESIGSGPASLLAREVVAPDKIVLVVPFDELKRVAADHAPYMPTGLIFADSWNNMTALAAYKGPLEIFGAEQDTIILVKHAQALAASVPQAKFHLIPGGHNDWSRQSNVRIRN